jgi:hypothetical protein
MNEGVGNFYFNFNRLAHFGGSELSAPCMGEIRRGLASNADATAHGWKDSPTHTELCICYVEIEPGKRQNLRRPK